MSIARPEVAKKVHFGQKSQNLHDIAFREPVEPFLQENTDFWALLFGHSLARNEGPECLVRGLNLLKLLEK